MRSASATSSRAHLQRLIDETGVSRPSTRSSCTRGLPQHELRAFHAEHGIATEAWSPLGRARLLTERPGDREIAARARRDPRAGRSCAGTSSSATS